MNANIELTLDELVQLLAAVGEYNGIRVNAVEFMADGQAVVPDRIILKSGMTAGLKVRTAPEENDRSLSKMLAEVRASYARGGVPAEIQGQNGHGAAGQ